MVIDIHNHFFPAKWPDLAERYGTPNWPWIKHTEPGKADIMVGERFFRHIYSACWDPEVRLQEMDRDGVEMQVISATPVLFAYDRPMEHALDSARFFNDAALELCGRGKGRLKSLCQVPLQDIDAACAELSRCMNAGHLGVQIGNHVGEKNLDDPGIVTFLHHCADEGAAVLVAARTEAEIRSVVAEMEQSGGRAACVPGDVSREADCAHILAVAQERLGPVDILVNNAGVYQFAPLEAVTAQEFHREFDTNVLGVILTIQESLKHFGAEGGLGRRVIEIHVRFTSLRAYARFALSRYWRSRARWRKSARGDKRVGNWIPR